MKTLNLLQQESIIGGGWFKNTLNFVSGACLGLGAAELLALSVIPSGYGQAVAGVCLAAGLGTLLFD
ncbi:MAG: hypothetical protein GW772_12430 [Flavobacteriia bacterium]|nr:hypothetical protein [Flavobacteriia bacterium]OIP47345.1 MAG: hypothetical protein AUK46_05370 [Flavobacteriaceae bacterium CG2_30_31_66]PIV95603.1 MAG: hypothetical protein COW43_12835 [Flavobacteriaceae bacterium CG17_big_fil_post_rev_8_21_14_2_50_31_13]PIX15336.1 MAG: hypothetical protein COZ74_00610 [Flavobacteriaceae bacterium CG_4_8_14_3_um_filter_31_8]PIY15982.1 MAG: hypothetical protein COZ16_01930 [Flavobacteriaceae bacterium CG_4_10_14_3_um_filter_31_253]PIZ11547.1 MAG: hypotheti